jgi:HlyD family secretion protein
MAATSPNGKSRKRWIVPVAAVALVAVVAAYVAAHSGKREIVLSGVVDANEVVVTPPVQARIDSLWVEEGSEVRAGDPVATLDRSELAAQAAAAGATAASVRAQLEQASASARETAGETAGQVAAAEARVASTRAEVARQQAELQRQRQDMERTRALVGAGAVAQADLDRAVTALRVQEQVVVAAREAQRAAEADARRMQAGTLATAAARGGVAATGARLRSAQADSAAAGARLGYAELRAPVSGFVQVLVARRGELVGPGAPVAVIVDADHPWVRVAAPESDAGAVAVGDSLEVRLASGQSMRGRVISKSVEGEFATQHDVSAQKRDVRAVAFRVAIANPRRAIVPGMTAFVVLPTERP